MADPAAAPGAHIAPGPDLVGVFAALGDPTRNALLTALAERGSGSATSLAATAQVSRQAVDRHLRVLEGAGLLQSRRRGREVLYTLEPATLARSSEWLEQLGRTWERKLAMLKAAAEAGEGAPRVSSAHARSE